MKTIRFAVTAGALALGLIPGFASTAEAAYVLTFSQVGNDVVATGSGTLDLTDLTYNGGSSGGAFASIFYMSNKSYTELGLTIGPSADSWYLQYGVITNVVSPPTGGRDVYLHANSGTGDIFGFTDSSSNGTDLILPFDYVSGSELSSTATWTNTDISALMLGSGSYTWSWGSGEDADSFTVNIDAGPADVPEPSSLAMLALPVMLGGMFVARRSPR